MSLLSPSLFLSSLVSVQLRPGSEIQLAHEVAMALVLN